MCLNSISATNLLEAFSQSLGIQDDYVTNAGFPGEAFFCVTTCAVGALCWVTFLVIVVITIILPVTVYILTLDLLYGQTGVFTLNQSFPEVL